MEVNCYWKSNSLCFYLYYWGLGTKTFFLIYSEKVKVEELKDWFDFGWKKNRGI